MGKALAVLLVLAVTTPLHAQKKITTVSPDEALKHKGKWVNVCGIVRDAAPTEKGGKLYFVNAKGESIWATPIHDLSARMNELPGSSVCAYGRTYWNLEGLGIDTQRLEFVAAGAPVRVINDGFPPPEASSEAAKPKRKFPWGAVIAAAVVGAAAIGAATSSGTTYAGVPAEPLAESVGPNARTYSIDSVSRGGEVIILSDGSAWEIEWRDQFRAAMWAPVQRVTLTPGNRYGQFVMVRSDYRTEAITVTRLR